MVTPKMASRRSTKRVLKPVIEKKRRDRINQRLDELRTLLLNNTLDSRLKNPKLEKAEILELTVEYIRTKATVAKDSSGDSNSDSLDANAPTLLSRRPHVSFSSFPEPINVHTQVPSNPIYKAGFKECISRLASFIDCVEPSQRDGFVQGLCHHLDSYGLRSHPWIPNLEMPSRTDVMRANASSLYPKPFLLHHPHPTGQAVTHPYPSPPYSLSPPPSPCYSSSSPPFSSSPTFLSVPCHFPFPPSISPLSSDSSSSSSSSSLSLSTPAVPVVPHLQVSTSSPTPVRSTSSVPSSQPRTLRRALFQNQSHSVWRPW